ncbi:MAG: alginate export family protein [Verrucomicrobiia bacterium]
MKPHLYLLALLLPTIVQAGSPALTGRPTSAQAKLRQDPWQPGQPITFYHHQFTLDFQFRERFEWRSNWIDFSDSTDVRDSQALLQRLRLGLKFQPVENFTAYAQLQDSRTFFDNPQNDATREFISNDSPIALRQGYLQLDNLWGQPLRFKIGRQILSYGDERLIGAFEWDNNARTFDALRLSYQNGGFTLDAFAGYVVLHRTEGFNNPDTTDLFTGLYATTDLIPSFDSDLFLLWRSKSQVTPSTTFTGRDERVDGNTAPAGDYATLGTRLKSKKGAFGPWDANAEFAFQIGGLSNPQGFGPLVGGNPININRQDLLAGALHIEGGYTFTHPWKPRLHLEYNYGSGDSDPNDGISHTFQNLFPTNHKFYGYMDRFSWQNLHNPAIGLTVQPTPKLRIKLDYHLFWLAETRDVWRFAAQQPVGGAPRYANALNRNPSGFVGSEIDLTLWYDLNQWLKLEAGYAHFFTGGYISDTAPTGQTADADFIYVQALISF